MATAAEKLEWIKARIAEGHTVYLSTALRVTVIKAKHLPQVRARGTVLEIQHGSRWLDYNGAALSAR